MTHQEWVGQLPDYAAGDLAEDEAEAVRAHLASGCASCLAVLFRLPVGRRVPPVAHAPSRSRRVSPLVPAVALLALALAALLGWTILDLREREADRQADVTRLSGRVAELEAGRREAIARLHATESDLDAARAEATNARQAAAAELEARHDVERTLAAAEERIGTLERGIRRRDAQLERLLQSAGQRTSRDWRSRPVSR